MLNLTKQVEVDMYANNRYLVNIPSDRINDKIDEIRSSLN